MIACICALLVVLAVSLQATGKRRPSMTRDELIRLRQYADKGRLEIGPPFE